MDAALRQLLPARYVQRHRVVPIERDDGVLVIGHGPNLAAGVLEEIAFMAGCEVRGRTCTPDEVERLIRLHYGVGASAIESLDPAALPAEPGHGRIRTQAVPDAASEPAIVSFVHDLLRQALRDGATDVHIEPFEDRLRVRFRIDGILHEIAIPEGLHAHHAAIVSRIKVMAQLDIAEHRLPQDGRIKAHVAHQQIDYRVSILPSQHGETVDLRVLSGTSILLGLEQLGFLPAELTIVATLLAKPHGVILVTGPTGSGKTTTLYSFLSVLNETARKILTIEDPIEYNLDGITQMQVHPRIGFSFARGLRSMLRHDPDVMMVGEIRDQETAETAIRVALTGHLVFSTLHTNDAPSTPTRLLDMGIEPYLVTSSVECILAQRLVRKICPQCTAPDPTPVDATALGLHASTFEELSLGGPASFQRGRGCAHCHQTGYRGRTAIFEILPMTEAIQEAILHRSSAAQLRRLARDAGYAPLRLRGLRLATAGVTSVEEVLRVTASHTEG